MYIHPEVPAQTKTASKYYSAANLQKCLITHLSHFEYAKVPTNTQKGQK